MLKFIGIALGLFSATVATAQPAHRLMGETSATVQVGDLDLAAPHGKSLLKARVAAAIAQLCGTYGNVADPNELDEVFACRADAGASARRQAAQRIADASRSQGSGSLMAANGR